MRISSSAVSASEPSVVCRPDLSNWGFVAFFSLFGLLSLLIPLSDKGTSGNTPGPKSDWAAALLSCTCFLFFAFSWAVWLLHARIIADEAGLRWRVVGAWRSARWEKVTDYYEQLPQKRNSPAPAIVETTVGRLKFDSSWQNSDALIATIACRGVKARVKTWGVIGTRPEDDWPRTFHYDTPQNKRQRLFVAAIYISMFGFVLGMLLEKAPRIITELGWGWGLSLCVTFSIALLLTPLKVFVLTGPLREAGKRRDRIEVSPSSLRFQDGQRELNLRWEDVTDYYVGIFGRTVTFHGRYTIVTRRGEFDFLPSVQDAMLLKEIIRRYADTPLLGTWRLCGDDALGGVASRWSGSCEGVGERIFGYRTRTNRALVGFLGFMSVLPLLSVLLHRWLGLPFNDDAPFVIAISTILGMIFLWSWWRYRTARIQIDSHGITQSVPFGKLVLVWSDVTDYYQIDDGFGGGSVISLDGRRIRFYSGIADSEELMGEITRLATHCHHRSWQEKGKQTALTNN